MSSVNIFHASEPAIDALDDADILLVYDASAGRTKRMTWAQARAGTVQTASTSANITNSGLTIVSSAMNGKELFMAAPVAGVSKRIAWVNSSSTSTVVITSTSMAVTFDSTTSYVRPCAITSVGQDRVLDLIGVSATQYCVVAGSTDSVNQILFSFTTS
jgi:hypothetical protein